MPYLYRFPGPLANDRRRRLMVGGAIGVGRGSGAPTTTFDPANKSTKLTLSNNNLTITANTSATLATSEVRSIGSHATGKFYAEFQLTTSANVGAVPMGLVVAAYDITADVYLGTDAGANSVGYFSDGSVHIANAVVTTIQTWLLNDVIGMAVDRTANLIWYRANAGNWNNSGAANPATGAGGISLATMSAGAVFAAVGVQAQNDVLTGNFGNTFAQAVPAGFGNW